MIVYLAGTEAQENKSLIEKGKIKHAFISYYYLRNRTTHELMSFYRKHIDRIVVDSGAHTFLSESESIKTASSLRKKNKTKETPFEFMEKYKRWVKEFYQYFDNFVELDIGEIVGQENVLRWRKELKELGVYNKCITVYHKNVMSIKDFDDMLDDSQSKYVALEGFRSGRRGFAYLPLIKKCYDRKIKVHGFAMTKDSVVENYPFYSVDSTSWRAGNQYGTAKVLTSEGTKIIRFKDREGFFKLKGSGLLDIHGENKHLSAMKKYELSINAYSEWEEKITRLWEKRGIKWD